MSKFSLNFAFGFSYFWVSLAKIPKVEDLKRKKNFLDVSGIWGIFLIDCYRVNSIIPSVKIPSNTASTSWVIIWINYFVTRLRNLKGEHWEACMVAIAPCHFKIHSSQPGGLPHPLSWDPYWLNNSLDPTSFSLKPLPVNYLCFLNSH